MSYLDRIALKAFPSLVLELQRMKVFLNICYWDGGRCLSVNDCQFYSTDAVLVTVTPFLMEIISIIILEWIELVPQSVPKRFWIWFFFDVRFRAGYSRRHSKPEIWRVDEAMSVIYISHPGRDFWQIIGMGKEPCTQADSRYFLVHTLQIIWGIMATYVQENWAPEPTVWTFPGKKTDCFVWRWQRGLLVLFIPPLFMRINTNSLLFPWSINGLLWLIEYFEKMTYTIYSIWIIIVSKIEKRITNSLGRWCSWIWLFIKCFFGAGDYSFPGICYNI